MKRFMVFISGGASIVACLPVWLVAAAIAVAAPGGEDPWKPAPGYEVTVTGGQETFGLAYQSPDFRKLIVALDSGEKYLINLVDRSVSGMPPASVVITDDGAKLDPKAKPTASGPFTRKGPEIRFQLGGRQVVIGPQPPLVGDVTLAELLKRKPDYRKAAGGYEPDEVAVERLRRHARPVEIVVFFGTWCPACRRWVPKFMAAMEETANPKIRVRYVAVGENYKEPRAEIEKYNMHLTPSFIVMDGSRELGRIKGKPVMSIEKDLAEILAGQP